MFERFTDKARDALVQASVEAGRLGHDFLGTEHLLLGLLQVDGVAARVLEANGFTTEEAREEVRRRIGTPSTTDAEALRAIGIDLDEVRAAIEESFGPGALDRPVKRRRGLGWRSSRPFTPRAKKVVELGLREALGLGHGYIGTEHLLLGLVSEGRGVAAQILAERVDLRTLRSKVIHELARLRPGA